MGRRLRVIFIFFCIWFIVIGFRLWYMQVLNKTRFTEMSRVNRTRIVRLPSPRGRIYDRNGRLIADNKAAAQLVVRIDDIGDTEGLADEISRLTRLSPEYILKKIKENIFKPFIPAVLASDLSDETLVTVSESRWRLPGLAVQIAPVRDYLLGEAFAHLIGYVGEAGKGDLEKGYSWGDIVGCTGIEMGLDRELRGTDGYKEVQVDYRGDVDRILRILEPQIGASVHLTIDSALQEELYNAMNPRRGAGIAMNPKTGEVLALVSSPGFNPNLLVSPVKEDTVIRLFTDKSRPMLNRAISGQYPPGSVFKIITALAALEKGVITKKTLFYCDGEFKLGDTRFRCWEKKGHGWVDLSNALKKSCNEYFYQAGLKAGAGNIIDMAERFGLNRLTGIGTGSEKTGLLPASGNWYTGDTVNLSIGQGRILVTPIQIASLISAIANGGILHKPRLIMGEEPEDVQIDIDKEYIDIVKEGLFRVVNEPDGTGHRAYVSGLDVAGKTGTVELKEKGRIRNICWFGGFAPFNDPEIAVAVVLEEGESGGATAGPIAQKIFRKWRENDSPE